MRTILLISLFISIFSSIDAKSGKEHKADMYKIMPFAMQPKIDSLYNLINACIDYKDIEKKTVGIPDTIRKAPLDANLKLGNHRVLFHWGFNSNPRKSEILKEKIDIYLSTEHNKKLKEIKEYAFWDRIITEQQIRNKYMIQKVCDVLGFVDGGKSGQYANAFASILVDIHIIGDYTTTHTIGLQDFNLVIADIKRSILKLAQNNYNDLTLAKEFNKKIDSIKGESPLELLSLLENNMGAYILSIENFKFKNHFEKLKLKLK